MNAIPTIYDQECRVSVISGEAILKGTLGLPAGARGIVLFAHGRGGSRHCPQNRHVAHILRQGKLATLLLDLLTHPEEVEFQQGQSSDFDLDLFVERLVGATDWLSQNPLTARLNIGYFGVDGGASAALVAAAERPEAVSAIVSHGPWSEQVGEAALQVKAPTLLLVGAEDSLAQHQAALEQLNAQKQLEIIPQGNYDCQETATLEKVAWLANQWFEQHLSGQPLGAVSY